MGATIMSQIARHSNRSKRTLSLEQLEKREVFAGMVFATFNPASNTIQITGDVQDNQIDVSDGAGALVIQGKTGTLVNGLPQVAFPTGRNLTINLGAGNDKAFIHDAALSSVQYNDQVGANTVRLENLNVTGNVAVSTGQEIDIVRAINMSAGGNVRIETRDGNDRVSFQGSVGLVDAPNPGIRDLLIDTGVGNDRVDVAQTRVNGNITIDLGAGNDVFTSNQVRAGNNLLLRMGIGDDTATLTRVSAGASKVYSMGDGNDRLRSDDASQAVAVSNLGGAGVDTIDFDTVLGPNSGFEIII
jgi:large repetitive protein